MRYSVNFLNFPMNGRLNTHPGILEWAQQSPLSRRCFVCVFAFRWKTLCHNEYPSSTVRSGDHLLTHRREFVVRCNELSE